MNGRGVVFACLKRLPRRRCRRDVDSAVNPNLWRGSLLLLDRAATSTPILLNQNVASR